MRLPLTTLALTIAIAGVLPSAQAQSVNSRGERYWNHNTDGWHFYRDPEKKQPEPEPEPEPAPVPVVIAPPTPPQAPVKQGPKPFSARWLKENMEKYRELAIDEPTPQNTELYAMLQRVALDKSERFAQAMQRVPMLNPDLDEFARSPITAVQRDAAEKKVSVAKRQVLDALSQRVGIWYFYSSTCPYCKQQEPILDRFQTRYAFSVLPISLDGGPLASGSGKSYVVNQGHAEQLGVMTTPTLVVADTATNQLYNLAAGLRTTSEIEERLLELARTEGWISEAQFDEAVRGEPRRYITDGLPNLAEVEEDPASLLEALKRASTSGGSTPWVVAPTAQ